MNQQNYLDILEIGVKEQCCSSLCCCGGSLMAGGDPAVADIAVPQPARWREWARWSRGAQSGPHIKGLLYSLITTHVNHTNVQYMLSHSRELNHHRAHGHLMC